MVLLVLGGIIFAGSWGERGTKNSWKTALSIESRDWTLGEDWEWLYEEEEDDVCSDVLAVGVASVVMSGSDILYDSGVSNRYLNSAEEFDVFQINCCGIAIDPQERIY